MNETLKKTDDIFFKNFKKSDDIINMLKKGPLNCYSEEVVFYGGELAKRGSEVISKFHSVHDNKLYYGYDNFDKINRVAKLFEKKKYRDAYEETGRKSIKDFVESEREIISDLKDYATLDLEELSEYNETVSKALSDIEKFIKENNLQQYDGDDFRSSVMKGKLDELHEIKESLFNIKTTIEVAIQFAVEGKRSLTVASDGILQNIAMIAAVGGKDAQRAWNGDYPKEDLDEIFENDKKLKCLLIFFIIVIIILLYPGMDIVFSRNPDPFNGLLLFFGGITVTVMFINLLGCLWERRRLRKIFPKESYDDNEIVQKMVDNGTKNENGSVSIPLDEETLIFSIKDSYYGKKVMMLTRKGDRAKEIVSKDITDKSDKKLKNIRYGLFKEILSDRNDGFRGMSIKEAHTESLKNRNVSFQSSVSKPKKVEYVLPGGSLLE